MPSWRKSPSMPKVRDSSGTIGTTRLPMFGSLTSPVSIRTKAIVVEISTTMAFVRMLTGLVKDPNIGKRVVPIVPDESRTFGMEGLFRQLGIYSQVGQLYEPEDSDQLMFYKEDKNGQILQEGINEAGGMCSWLAAAPAYRSGER